MAKHEEMTIVAIVDTDYNHQKVVVQTDKGDLLSMSIPNMMNVCSAYLTSLNSLKKEYDNAVIH